MEPIFFHDLCDPIDGTGALDFFSRFPVGISKANNMVATALDKIAKAASSAGSSERFRARIRLSNPRGDAFSICHSSADPQRLVLIACIVEIMWIHDGIVASMLLPHGTY